MIVKTELEGLVIEPEGDQDKAYIRDTLGLKAEGDRVTLERRDAPDFGGGPMALRQVKEGGL